MIDWVIASDFLEAENLPRALRCAHSVVDALQAGQIDPLLRQEEILLAYEVLCDAPAGEPAKAYRAVTETEERYRQPERWESDSQLANATRRACWLALAGEIAHRDGRYRQAVVHCIAGFGVLEAAAGGEDKLLKLVASSKPGPLGEAATALGACWPGAMRRATYLPEAKEALQRKIPHILPAILVSGAHYPRTHAFATQTLFEQVELEIPDSLDDLRAISDQTRGSSLRSRVTAPLVAMEYERGMGSLEEAKREARKALEGLEGFGLERHLERMDQYGYLAFAS
jgi:hypothetical protein